jgi:tRNA pseudouridine55 synthase
MLDGLLVIDKPHGMTSHDVVARVRKSCGQRKVGHAGTLDPDATGVLLVGLGRVTRLLRFLQGAGKAYRARVAFGVATDTLDAAGVVVDRRAMPFTAEDLRDVVPRFVGDVEQVPPMVSAVKVGGRRLHELARAGQEIERAPRRVRIDRIDVESFEPGPYPRATLFVECGPGTYLRTLAADLGAARGGCAHVEALRRTRVGSFDLSEAVSLEALEADPRARLLTPRAAMRDLEEVTVDDETARAVSHGAVFAAAALGRADDEAGPFALVDPSGALRAVYERRGEMCKPAVVLA